MNRPELSVPATCPKCLRSHLAPVPAAMVDALSGTPGRFSEALGLAERLEAAVQHLEQQHLEHLVLAERLEAAVQHLEHLVVDKTPFGAAEQL